MAYSPGVAESVDAPDLGSGGTPLLLGETSRASSSLATRTKPSRTPLYRACQADDSFLSAVDALWFLVHQSLPLSGPYGEC